MIVGTRQKSNTIGNAASYRHDPLYPYAKAFVETCQNIFTNETVDLFAEPSRAIRSNAVKEALRENFCNNFVDDANVTKTPDQIEEMHEDVDAMFENDLSAITEHAYMSDFMPMVGMALPIHKLILMNNVFSQGDGIQTVTAVQPGFTVSLERRILVTPTGEEIDMFLEQNRIADAIDATAPIKDFEVELPQKEGDTDFIAELGGNPRSDLSIATHVSGIYVEGVYIAEGQPLPDENDWYSNKGKPATAEEAGTYNVYFPVNLGFTPLYGKPGQADRGLNQPITLKYVKNASGDVEVLKDTLFGTLNNGKISLVSLNGNVTKVRIAAKLDTSSVQMEMCSVKWDASTEYVEIPEANPVNTTVSPEEVKDIAAMYDSNQVTKIMSMTKTALSEYKDKKMKAFLDDSYKRGDERNTFEGEFDFAVPEGYALDWVTFRAATFMDYFDDIVTRMLQVLNDPNMTFSIYGDPRVVRKITPTEYTYQAPANIGPVTLDYTQTIVNTKDQRVYNFVGSDKMRDTNELMILMNPRNTSRIVYRLYNYQLYISNEIRNPGNVALPAIHSFERWKMYEMFPVQSRIHILNPSGMRTA